MDFVSEVLLLYFIKKENLTKEFKHAGTRKTKNNNLTEKVLVYLI